MDGDCGSWVVDSKSGALYGQVVSGYPGTGKAYITPAADIFSDMENVLGRPVHLPAVENATVSLLIQLREMIALQKAMLVGRPTQQAEVLTEEDTETKNETGLYEDEQKAEEEAVHINYVLEEAMKIGRAMMAALSEKRADTGQTFDPQGVVMEAKSSSKASGIHPTHMHSIHDLGYARNSRSSLVANSKRDSGYAGSNRSSLVERDSAYARNSRSSFVASSASWASSGRNSEYAGSPRSSLVTIPQRARQVIGSLIATDRRRASLDMSTDDLGSFLEPLKLEPLKVDLLEKYGHFPTTAANGKSSKNLVPPNIPRQMLWDHYKEDIEALYEEGLTVPVIHKRIWSDGFRIRQVCLSLSNPFKLLITKMK